MWQSFACLSGAVVVLSYLRFAVGAFVLAASLLIGNAAVADADSSDSAAPGPGGANASIQGSTTSRQGSTTSRRPVGDVTDTLRTTIQRVMRTLGSVRQSGQQPYRGAEMPNIGSGGTDIKDGTKDGSGLGAAVSDPVAAVPNEVAPVSDPVAAVPNEVAPVSDPVAAVPNEVAPVSDAVAAVPNEVAQFLMRSRRCLSRWRRFRVGSGQFLASARRSSRSTNCLPIFIPSGWASPGWRQFLMSARWFRTC